MQTIIELLEEVEGLVVISGPHSFTGFSQLIFSLTCQKLTTFDCKRGTYSFNNRRLGLMNMPMIY